MSEVRVLIRLGTLRLDYQGDQAFYETHIEALVAAAAARGVRGPVTGPRTARTAQATTFPPAASGPSAPDASAERQAPSAAEPAAEAWKPSSPEFGRYLRRLGPEADAPDLHVLAFAFYLWNYERAETFGLDEIAGCLRAIGRDLPEDADAVMADLTDRRRFLESVAPGRWRLAKKGENYVKTRLLTV